MKKIIAAIVMLAILFNGCKKNKTDEDITSLFQNTIWSGEIKFGIIPFPEPFSVTFDGHGGLIWEDRLGIFNGTYSLDKSDKSITIDMPRGKFKAIISNQKFSTVTYDAAYGWKINSGELNDESGQLLANTLWKGTETAVPNTQKPCQMKFIINQKINFNEGPDNYPYVKSGPALRLDFGTWGYFFVLQPGNKLQGIFWETYSVPGSTIYHKYELSKQ